MEVYYMRVDQREFIEVSQFNNCVIYPSDPTEPGKFKILGRSSSNPFGQVIDFFETEEAARLALRGILVDLKNRHFGIS